MDSFYNLAKHRRSIRKYKSDAIEQEKVDSILRTALMSPASKRTNGWEFIVVDDKSLLKQLSECREHGSGFLADAPMAIVVTCDTQKSDVWFEDASIAATFIQLAASDLGLGSCWAQVYTRIYKDQMSSVSYVRGILDIPEQFEVLCIIGIGYPDEERKPFDEAKLNYEKIHKNNF